MFLASRARPVRRVDNLTAICELLCTYCGILDVSRPCYGDSSSTVPPQECGSEWDSSSELLRAILARLCPKRYQVHCLKKKKK
jgi:hypothetical protein